MADEITIKGCPICGKEPEVSTKGSCIDIDCCVSMNMQKSDEMTMQERKDGLAHFQKHYVYHLDIESRLLRFILEKWNTRAVIK